MLFHTKLETASRGAAQCERTRIASLRQMGATLWPQLCLCLALVSRSIAAPRQHIHFKGGLASRAAAAQKLSEQWSGCSRGQRYRRAERGPLAVGLRCACSCSAPGWRSRFVRYEPSAWEVEAGREDACQQVTSEVPRVAEWLSSVRVRPQCWAELRAAQARPCIPQARTGGAGLQHDCRGRHRQPRAGRSSERVLLGQLRRSRVLTACLPERLPG